MKNRKRTPKKEHIGDLLTTTEAGVRLRLSRDTIIAMIRKGTFTIFKVGRQYRLLKDEIEDYIQKCRLSVGEVE